MPVENRNCQNCKKSFAIVAEDFEFYKKMAVPPPTWCPECRMMRRMCFFNERSFYKKVEKRTGKEIFSMFPPDAPIEIYDRDYWWSDAWDKLASGREYDFSKPFFRQFRELQRAQPWHSRAITRSTGSDYSNNVADMKNCYLCFNADKSEDCMYGVGMVGIKNSLDCYRTVSCEYCYELETADNCYQSFFISFVVNCRNVWLCYNCEDCSDCFGCVNLRHKKYHIFNQPYSKEEYFAKLKEMNTGSYSSFSKLRQEFADLMMRFPRKYMTGVQNQNVIGDYLSNSKNSKYVYAGGNCENVKYSQSILMGAKDSHDYTNWGNNVELMYETLSCGENDQRVKFSYDCWSGATDVEYSMNCISCTNMFGCVGILKKNYCILNKEYSKEEYEALLPKIKKHMDEMPYVDAKGRVYKYGEFFPPEFSFFAANESAIVDFMDMTKEQALAYGLAWREASPKEYAVTMQSGDIPDNIADSTEDITKQIIACAGCKKGYRIIPGEFQFLKRFGIPAPRHCFNCRHARRVNLRNKPRWYQGSCQCVGAASKNGLYQNVGKHPHEGVCTNTFETSYAPDQKEIVYCESCYQQEVV